MGARTSLLRPPPSLSSSTPKPGFQQAGSREGRKHFIGQEDPPGLGLLFTTSLSLAWAQRPDPDEQQETRDCVSLFASPRSHLICLFLLDANLLFCFPILLPFALLPCAQGPRDMVGRCLPLRPIRELGSAAQVLWSMLKGSHRENSFGLLLCITSCHIL